MLKLITTLTFFLFGMLAKGQVSETRNVTDFTKMEVKNATVIFTESNQSSLKIESEYNDAPETILTEISNGTLKITGKNAGEKTIVYVCGRNVSHFNASKNGKITVTSEISTPETAIVLSSGASFFGNVNSAKATITAKNGTYFKGHLTVGTLTGDFNADAKVILCGTAKNASIHTRSNNRCNARNFVAESLIINAEGNSDVTIHAKKLIDISVVDSAKVVYNGVPQKVTLNENAVATTKIKGDKMVSYNY